MITNHYALRPLLVGWAALAFVACGGGGAVEDGGGSPAADVPDAVNAGDTGPDVAGPAVGDTATSDAEGPGFDPALPPGTTLADPVLLTFAAARARARYLVDEGYTLARQPDGALGFETDTAGTLGLAFEVDGVLHVLAAGDPIGPVLSTTTSDGVRFVTDVAGVDVGVSFVVVSSQVATLVVDAAALADRTVTVTAWLRRCDGGYSAVGDFDDESGTGLVAAHSIDIPRELTVVGRGSYVEALVDGLAFDAAGASWSGLPACGDGVAADVAAASAAAAGPGDRPEAAAVLVVRAPLPEDGRIVVRRAVALPEDGPAGLVAALAAAAAEDHEALLAEGEARLAKMPPLPGLTREEHLVYRSSFALLDQAMMPAEGLRETDYYLFAREPTWWFGRLGQHLHESLAMVLMARFDPAAALASQANFVRRVEENGYLPYNIGPVVEQTVLGTASPPLLSYVSDAIEARVGDAEFLAAAYEAGVRFHGFWTTERDRDGDGLSEWGGFPITESVRDLENVIWENVASPNQVESLDANVWLVLEEQALARMARRLGREGEAAEWEDRATARAALVNDTFWDEETGFYYHVAYRDNSFGVRTPGDLKRMEIAGFLPLIAGIVPVERRPRLLATLFDPALFWRATGVAGLAATDPYYDPAASSCCRWRGPVWVPWQWWISRSLRELGETERADELADRVVAAVAAQLRAVHQFRELFDADDPVAPNVSMPNYVWTALVADLLRDARR